MKFSLPTYLTAFGLLFACHLAFGEDGIVIKYTKNRAVAGYRVIVVKN